MPDNRARSATDRGSPVLAAQRPREAEVLTSCIEVRKLSDLAAASAARSGKLAEMADDNLQALLILSLIHI